MAGDLPPINIPALAAALLSYIDTLVPQWLAGGVQKKNEWVCGSLAGEAGGSCSVRMSGDKSGFWKDFATGEEGRDLVSLYAAIHGKNNAMAAIDLARQMGLESVAGVVKTASGAPVSPVANPRPQPAPKPKPVSEGWSTVVPVPDWAPEPTFAHYHRKPDDIANVAAYRDGDALLGYVVRFKTSDGGKDDLPYTFTRSARDGGTKWNWKQWDEPRPLYLADGQRPNGRTVVLVEGEIKADLLQQTLDAYSSGVYAVASWAGGSNAWAKADWSWITDATVLLWPDADSMRARPPKKEMSACKTEEERQALKDAQPYLNHGQQPGAKAMMGIGAILREQGCDVKVLPITLPGVKPSGYDCKDYILSEGWTGEHIVTSFFAKAYTPGWGAADATEPEKNDSPVSTKGGGEGGGKGGGKPPPEGDAADSSGRPAWLDKYWDWKKGRWDLRRSLVVDALRCAPELKGCVAYNELTKGQDVRRPWPWNTAQQDDNDEGSADLLARYLTDTYGVGDVSLQTVGDAIRTVGYEERYHPVREYLDGLQWDGKKRLDKWLVYVLGENPQSLNPALFEYLCKVGAYWLQGMVWRVMRPGCKFDYMPVLEGAGGLGKSTLARLLCAQSKWYSDSKFDLDRGKEAHEQVRGKWLYEIGELSSFSKAGVNDIKAFVSSMTDNFRPAYDTKSRDFQRQVVLVGTTNDDKYLRDRTGNRRFWPVPVRHKINLAWLEHWRDQLFAEARARFDAGAEYHPTEEEELRLFVPMQDSRLVESVIDGELLRLLTRPASMEAEAINCETERVPLGALVKALHVDAGKSTRAIEQQVQGWLKSNGWVNKGRQRIGGMLESSVYFRPAVWPPEIDEHQMGWAEPGGAPAPAPAQPGTEQEAVLSAAEQIAAWRGELDAPF